jgi:hypothetical protein
MSVSKGANLLAFPGRQILNLSAAPMRLGPALFTYNTLNYPLRSSQMKTCYSVFHTQTCQNSFFFNGEGGYSFKWSNCKNSSLINQTERRGSNVSLVQLNERPQILISAGRCFVDFLRFSKQISWNTRDHFLSYPFSYVRELLQYGSIKAKLSSWERSVDHFQRYRPAGTLRMSDMMEKLWPAKPFSSKVFFFFLAAELYVRIRGGTRVLLINNNRAAWQVESRAGPCNLLCGAGNFDKMGSAGGQHQVQFTEWGMDKYTYNCLCKFTCVFFYISRSKNIFILIASVIKMQFTT